MDYTTYIITGLTFILACAILRTQQLRKPGHQKPVIPPASPAEAEPNDDFICFMMTDGSTIATSGDVTVRGQSTKPSTNLY